MTLTKEDAKTRQALQSIQRTMQGVVTPMIVACICVSVFCVAGTMWLVYLAIALHNLQSSAWKEAF
jgi:hypothetical protein